MLFSVGLLQVPSSGAQNGRGLKAASHKVSAKEQTPLVVGHHYRLGKTSTRDSKAPNRTRSCAAHIAIVKLPLTLSHMPYQARDGLSLVSIHITHHQGQQLQPPLSFLRPSPAVRGAEGLSGP